MITIADIKDFLVNYRVDKSITYTGSLTDADFAIFCEELNEKVSQLSFVSENPNATVIPYSGTITNRGVFYFGMADG